MSQSDIIISGPELSFKIYDGSLAEYLLQKLRALPLDNIIQVKFVRNVTNQPFSTNMSTSYYPVIYSKLTLDLIYEIMQNR